MASRSACFGAPGGHLPYAPANGDVGKLIFSPGINIAEGALLGLASVAINDLEPWTIHGGVPATKIQEKKTPVAKPPLENRGR